MGYLKKSLVLMATLAISVLSLLLPAAAADRSDVDRLLHGPLSSGSSGANSNRPDIPHERRKRASELLHGPLERHNADSGSGVVVVDDGTVILSRVSLAHARPIECGFGFSLAGATTFEVDRLPEQKRIAVGDVSVRFLYDGSRKWTRREIDVVMGVLRTLAGWTGSNALLLTNPKFDHRHLNLVKTTAKRLNELVGRKPSNGGAWAGLNKTTSNDSFILLPDWDETDAKANRSVRSTLVHEIGHNIDTIYELAELTKARADNEWGAVLGMGVYWKFVMLTGWLPGSNYELTSAHRELFEHNIGKHVTRRDQITSRDSNWRHHRYARFARSYGETNPFEDWATTFELYYRIVEGEEGTSWRNKHRGMINKLKVIDALVACLNSRCKPRLFTLAELEMVLGNSKGVPW